MILQRHELTGWLRSGSELQEIDEMVGWVSPRLGIRFEFSEGKFQIYRPDGQQFATYVELAQQKEQERQRAEQAEAKLQEILARLQERGINLEDL
jgi:hypothetical protein